MKHYTKQVMGIVTVILIGTVLATYILRKPSAAPAHADHTEHAATSSETVTTNTRPQHGAPGHNHAQDHLPLPEESHVHADTGTHAPQATEFAKGPHGGKLFTQDNIGLEVTIYEQSVAPEFRVYVYQAGQALAPTNAKVTMQLSRLGRDVQTISFTPEQDYLKGNAVILEPHSFDLRINATVNNQAFTLNYSQVEARVQLTDKQLTENSIEVLTAGPAAIQSSLQLQGEIKLNADNSVQMVPRVGGMVESVNVNAGDTVKKGQVLAVIASVMIADMRSDLLAAQQQLALARSTYEREKQLWEEKVSAQQDYLLAQKELSQAEINVNRLRQKLTAMGAGASAQGQTRYEMRAPINGVITQKNISQGQVVTEADSVFEVADLATVWAEMTLYAKDIPTVKVGQSVTIAASAFEAKASGKIAYVSALVGTQSRTGMARVVIANPQRNWLPGLPVNVELVAEEVAVPLAVSVEALQTLNDSTVVFGRYGDYFEARPVVLGRRDAKYAEVLDGLVTGERYAAGNSFLVKADIGKAGATHDH
ncbi:MAG TPA: efflux RND transporter periplasmic adaptor subunit [Methylophilus sp.]